jgi:membrane protease YdiL (CAAX protease family)
MAFAPRNQRRDGPEALDRDTLLSRMPFNSAAETSGEHSPVVSSPRDAHARQVPTPAGRAIALVEVLLCSDYPTQIALGSALVLLGFRPLHPDGSLSLSYVAALSLADTSVLIGLILFCLRAHGERPRTVLLGRRPTGTEFVLGIKLLLPAFAIAVVSLGAILQFAPQLHTVAHNPLQDLMRSPRDTAVFGLVVVVAGGIREEIQRAFLLHRFEQWLGGAAFGTVVTSAAFGAGHLPQGVDATIATALLGAFWGIVYLRRRSAVAPVVSHSGFNLLQLVQFVLTGQ